MQDSQDFAEDQEDLVLQDPAVQQASQDPLV